MTEVDPRCEVVAVGAELLRGEITNRNAAWLGEQLAAAGWQVTRSTVVTDDEATIAALLREAAGRVPVVVVTGGLGPTQDDLTREGIARAAGVDLVRDPALERELLERMAARGRDVPHRNLRQADVPAGGRALANTEGTAPGLVVSVGTATVFALPGVPREMHAMLAASVLPALRELAPSARPRVSVTVRTAGLWESEVAELLAALELRARAAGEPEVAFLASGGQTRVVLTGVDRAGLEPWLEEVVSTLGSGVVEVVDGAGGDPVALPAAVVARLTERGQTVAVAESLTAGLVTSALADVAGASAVLRGGVTAYALAVKAEVLGVSDLARGAVSDEAALQMARGVRERLAADWGIATTGVAGPGSSAEGLVAGTVHVAVVGPAVEEVRALALPGDRARVRQHATVAVLDLLRRQL